MCDVLKCPVKIALVQNPITTYKLKNLSVVRSKIIEAYLRGSQIVILGECFCMPYGIKYFSQFAEIIPRSFKTGLNVRTSLCNSSKFNEMRDSSTVYMLQSLALQLKIIIIGGSIPERCPITKKLFNTTLVFDSSGRLLGAHRKVHLFDINIPEILSFNESSVISAGDSVTVLDIPKLGKIGVGICYDLRFPELAVLAARQGAFMMVYPAAFSKHTGELHWELLGRARALDNQLYVVLCSTACPRDLALYQTYGHSMVIDPVGKILVSANGSDIILYTCLSPDTIKMSRSHFPLEIHRRFDVYPDISLSHQDNKVLSIE